MQNRKLGALALVPVGAVFAVPSFAAVPEGVTTAITAAGTDAGVVAAAMLVVIIGLVAWKLIRRAAH
ncbi:MAG: hypothetical protein IPF57_13670 [Gammaproteobacteria bacterium]|jgi:uncharacterized membrane protein|nr:hypothetical protein [Gammaproteobacteria bacterium]